MSNSTVAIERLEPEHLPQAHALSRDVGWPHRQEDWAFVLGPGRGFAATCDGELLGTTMWWPFGERHATVGMVLVARAMQGRGLGRRLMQAALAEAGARTMLLNATAEGLPLYEKLGFRAIGAVRQHHAAGAVPVNAVAPAGTRPRRLAANDLDAVIALEARAAGFQRAEMLNALAGRVHSRARARRRVDGLRHVSPLRPGLCHRAGGGGGSGWRQSADRRLHRRAPLGIPAGRRAGVERPLAWLGGQGLPQVGKVVTMVRGHPTATPQAPRLFALANQALG